MKKKLLLTILCLCMISTAFAQTTNVTVANNYFADPDDGIKYQYLFNGEIAGWISEDTVFDHVGRDNVSKFSYNSDLYIGYCNNSAGEIYQALDEVIPATATMYTLSMKNRLDWVAGIGSELYSVLIFSAYNTDPIARVRIDSVKILMNSNSDRPNDTIIEGSITIPAASAFAGKKLAIGYVLRATDPVNTNNWANIDSVFLKKTVVVDGTNTSLFSSFNIPNPSNGLFNLKTKLGTNIEVFDLNGRLILSRISHGNDLLDLTNNKGVYLLRATTNTNNLIVQKLVIK